MATRRAAFRHDDDSNGFWGSYLHLARGKVLPYQWEALNDRVSSAEPSGAIRNFRIAAGLESGEFHGFVFQDSDIGKWIEAVAWSLRWHPDPLLEARVDETVELLAKAQAADGYLNSYFTVKEPGRRWTNLWECHELYSAGHLLEGAVAYFQATGKRRFLDIMLRYVDLIDATFGPGPDQIRGYDGHEEIELALLHLYELSKDERHLRLAAFFLEERGQQPFFFHRQWEELGRVSHWSKSKVGQPELGYFQSHQPIREQAVAVGHAVRAVYLYAAMADLASKTGDAALRQVCETLWRNIRERQLYVTGAIGSTNQGEAFTFDYDLPNDTAYAETCASIGLIFFSQRLLEGRPDAVYADVIEQALTNTVLAGMSLDGHQFFYVNPQEVWPRASVGNPSRHHVKARRQAWFGCACCPPNLARLLLSIDRYVALAQGDSLFINQYLPGRIEAPFDGQNLVLDVATDYPRQGRIAITVRESPAQPVEIALRLPGWCRGWSLVRDGKTVRPPVAPDGYLRLAGPWARGDSLVLELGMEVQVLEAHPELRANAGKACLRRGPLVYCLEETDNQANLSALRLLDGEHFSELPAPGLPEGTVLVEAAAQCRSETGWDGQLYRTQASGGQAPEAGQDRGVRLRAVPYHLWGNRQPGELAVWIRR